MTIPFPRSLSSRRTAELERQLTALCLEPARANGKQAARIEQIEAELEARRWERAA